MKRLAAFATFCLLLAALSAPAMAQSAINVSWTFPTAESSTIDGFRVYCSTTLTAGILQATVVPGTARTAQINRPGYGLWNCWTAAFKGATDGPISNTVSQTFGISAPGSLTITNVIADATTVAPGKVRFAWETNAPADTRVLVGFLKTNPERATSHDMTVQLARQTLYQYRLESDTAAVTGEIRTK